MRSSASRSATSAPGLALGDVGLLLLGVLVGPIAVAGAFAGAAWGLAAGLVVGLVYLALVLGAALLVRRSEPPRVDAPAPKPAHVPGGDGSSRLLITVGEAVSRSEHIPAGVRSLIASADDILVMAPTLPGRLDWLASDTDKARAKADHRLQAVLGHLDEMGADARGQVGADDPMQAFEDAVEEFDPDHLLIALRREDRKGWQEKGLLDQIDQRFALPTTVFQL